MEPHDPNEGFGPIVFGCVMLALVVTSAVAVLWINGGAP